MIVDLAKLFPKSSNKQGITQLKVDSSTISSFKRNFSNQTVNDEVIVEDKMYLFEPIDDGLIHLINIKNAEDIIEIVRNNKHFLDNADDLTLQLIHLAQQCLDSYKKFMNCE